MNKVFLETIRVEQGRALHLPFHQERMERTLKHFHIQKEYILSELLSPPQSGIYRCRVCYSNEKIEIEYIPYEKHLPQRLKMVEAADIAYDYKYENREVLQRLFMQKGDADDVLIVQNGFVRDTTIANVAFFNGKEWLTPKEPLLLGTTRARYLKESKVKEAEIRVEELSSYKKMALMNAMVDFAIIPVEKIEEIMC